MHQLISCYMLGFDSRRVLNGNHLPWMWYAMKIFPLQSHSTPPPVCNGEVLPAVVNLWQRRRILCWSLLYIPRPRCCWRASWQQRPLPPTILLLPPRRKWSSLPTDDAYNRIWTSLLLTTDEFYSALNYIHIPWLLPSTYFQNFKAILQILDQKSNSAANLIDQSWSSLIKIEETCVKIQ